MQGRATKILPTKILPRLAVMQGRATKILPRLAVM